MIVKTKQCCPHCGQHITYDQMMVIKRSYNGSHLTDAARAARAENARKMGGRPKGVKNKAPRIDKGVKKSQKNLDLSEK